MIREPARAIANASASVASLPTRSNVASTPRPFVSSVIADGGVGTGLDGVMGAERRGELERRRLGVDGDDGRRA